MQNLHCSFKQTFKLRRTTEKNSELDRKKFVYVLVKQELVILHEIVILNIQNLRSAKDVYKIYLYIKILSSFRLFNEISEILYNALNN